MWCVAGLGNPGERYWGTRHNVGYHILDAVAEHYGLAPFRVQRSCALTQMPEEAFFKMAPTFKAPPILLVKPLLYMNLSGTALAPLVRFYKISPERLLVIHDDLDLGPGIVRMKQGGGAGGHKGLQSLDAHVGRNYWRLRIGIGHPGRRERVTRHVLEPFSPQEVQRLEPLCALIAEKLPLFFANSPHHFMTEMVMALKAAMCKFTMM